MRVLLVVNPTATTTTAGRRVRAERALARSHRLETAETTHRGHAVELARAAAADGVDVVVALAGDGTLNEVANGLVGSRTALAVLPGGSTNVFARTIGLPRAFDHALHQLVGALDRADVTPIGVGVANGRRFLFHLGAGFDAQVIAIAEDIVRRRPWIKRRAAQPLMALSAIRTVVGSRARAQDPAYRVELAGGATTTGAYAIVSNSTPYAYVGPRALTITTAAALDRPLALTSLRHVGPGVLARSTWSSLRGRGLRHPAVDQHADLHDLELVALGRPVPWQVDGDHLGSTDRLVIRYEPAALRVVRP